jgi:hypothetical protein
MRQQRSVVRGQALVVIWLASRIYDLILLIHDQSLEIDIDAID